MPTVERAQLGHSLIAITTASLLLIAPAPAMAADTGAPTAGAEINEGAANSGGSQLPGWIQQLFGLSSASAAATTNGSRFVGQSSAGSLRPGETRRVSVTMRNTGTSTWTRASGYKLGSQNPQDNRQWTSGTRIHLSPVDSIGPGETKTFSFNVTAPSKPGRYNMQWRMVHEGVEWFGAYTANVLIIVEAPPAPTNQARFVNQSVPTSLQPGETRIVSVTMNNTGSTTWTRAGNYKLGSQNPQDNRRWTGATRVYLSAAENVRPGQNKTFSFAITAPTTPGSYNFQWRMVQDGVEWFGARTATVNITVEAAIAENNAHFVNQAVTGSLTPGETRTIAITMRNTGSTTWTGAGGYKLGSQNPQDNKHWGLNRVYLVDSDQVRPGETKTFAFAITAPTAGGRYFLQWRMVQDGVEWFGDHTQTAVVIVDTSTLNSAEYVSQSVAGSLKPGETSGMSVTMRNTGSTTWTHAGEYKLGSQNPQDNKNWGRNRVYLAEGEEVKPRESKTFTFDITAPTEPGTHDLQWRMVQDGVEWFGDYTLTANIRVVDLEVIGNDAFFVEQSVPTVMAPGETTSVSITMRNIGFSTWTRADNYKLGSQNPQDNRDWGRNRVYLADGDAIKPGDSIIFSFDITAPSEPGREDFRWRMVRDGDDGGWFGDFSLNQVIEISDESPDTLRFGVVAAPGIGNDLARIRRIEELGVGWVRVAYDWNDMQPTRHGPIKWELAERIVNRLNDIGVKTYWDFSYAPGWANGRPSNGDPDRTYPPLNQQDLYDFVHAVVTRFKGRVDYWGTWNEPNLDQFYQGDVHRFVTHELPTTLRAIRDANPSANIVVGELSSSGNPYPWLERILNTARGQFDVVSHHVYDGDDSCGGRTRAMDVLRGNLVRWGFADKPVWITETGLDEPEHRKSAFLTCFYDEMESRPWWSKTFWFRLEHEPRLNWSLLDSRGAPKQSYRTYQDYIRGESRTATLPAESSSPRTFWQDDNFDDLKVGNLNRQAGWLRAAKRASAKVVASDSGNAVALDPRAGKTIAMSKDIADQTENQHAFSFRVKVEGADSPSVAKIEFGTKRNLGWDKKFQIFFGNSMRVNYGADGRAVQFLSATEPGRWYTVSGDIDLDRGVLDIAVDGILAAPAIPIHPGPIISLGFSAWDRPGSVTLDDFQGSTLDVE